MVAIFRTRDRKLFPKTSDWVGVIGDGQRGAVYLEQLVLIGLVAIGFSAAAVTLGPLLLGYHMGIELVLSLPIP
jgi:hypothetical protein